MMKSIIGFNKLRQQARVR